VNNAGATKRADFFTLTEEDWQDGFAQKFHGCVKMTPAAWPHLRESRGTIVNIVCTGFRPGGAEFTIGNSFNVAPLNFTKATADVGIAHDLRVNAINPGLIQTDRFTRDIERVTRDRGLSHEDARTFPVSSHGITRVGTLAEVGALVAYLASSKPDFLPGAVIDIDGGATRSL
jgi:NAD(P)-dependent dehydrogenase (short-subunit alcohol dehydrogenase family)